MNHIFGFKVLDTSVEVYFPTNPEAIQVSGGNNFVSYNVLQLGELQIPRGRKARRVRWRGWLPGPGYCWGDIGPGLSTDVPEYVLPLGAPVVRMPSDMIGLLQDLFDRGERGLVSLGVTNTVVAWTAYLSTFDYSYEDAYGSVNYSVEWVEARELGAKKSDVPVWVPNPANTDPRLPQPTPALPGGQPQTGPGTASNTPSISEVGTLRPASTTQQATPTTYRASGGESWMDVAYRTYGDTRAADSVRQANPALAAEERLAAGATVIVPVYR